jgi:hypothetical protein
VAQDVYLLNFVQARFTDVTFKGFYSTGGQSSEDAINNSLHGSDMLNTTSLSSNHHQQNNHHSSDEEMRDEYSEFDHNTNNNH